MVNAIERSPHSLRWPTVADWAGSQPLMVWLDVVPGDVVNVQAFDRGLAADPGVAQEAVAAALDPAAVAFSCEQAERAWEPLSRPAVGSAVVDDPGEGRLSAWGQEGVSA